MTPRTFEEWQRYEESFEDEHKPNREDVWNAGYAAALASLGEVSAVMRDGDVVALIRVDEEGRILETLWEK